MNKEINLIFHNLGLRTYIEVDLCAECPRQDDKGCCGHYSPVFYPTDLAYLYLHQADIIDRIFAFDHLTILDHSVTVNNVPDGDSYRCKFHSKNGGCLLEQTWRESICRHFVCPGIGWWEESVLQEWKEYMEKLTDYEIELNQRLAEALDEQGLSLRNPDQREKYFRVLIELYQKEIGQIPDFINRMPVQQSFRIVRPLHFGKDWQL
ncbi:MAG: hypothetical protein GXY49_00395 [Syntrophomonadaceae bacterium]|nr:hypothetical protein [Syntrophomonadaceae bacterium]